ncbi:MAG TPA: hypothetical protein VFZ42_13700 [Chitinophagaceae bacterium]
MRTYHFVIETILIAITFIMLIDSFFISRGYGIAVWWAILGILQVLHAITLNFAYRTSDRILKYLKWYFLGVIISGVLLGVYLGLRFRIPLSYGPIATIVLVVAIMILPALLALYLWFITWRFRRSSIVEKTG